MNKLLSVTIIILIFSACYKKEKSESLIWREFVSHEGQFKTLFPGVPEESLEEREWNNFRIQTYKFAVSSAIVFSVRYTDYPDAASTNQEKLKYYYDYQRDLAQKLTNSKLISEREIRLDDTLGREVIVERQSFLNLNNQIDIYRFYFVGNRMFQINTSIKSSRLKNTENEANMQFFLDSFHIIEKKSQKRPFLRLFP